MIATVSPAEQHYEESLSTLKYVQRAKRIVNQVRAAARCGARRRAA